MDEGLEQKIKLNIQMNRDYNKGKPKHLQRTTNAKKLRKNARVILEQIEKDLK